MKARLLVCVSYATLLAISSARAQQSDPPQAEVAQREQAAAVAAGIAPRDLTEDTVKIIKDKIASETTLKNAQSQETAAQQNLQKAGADVQSAKAEADKAYQALIAAGLSPVSIGQGKVTTADQAKLQAALTSATQGLNSADAAVQQAQLDAQILAKNPGAFTPQQREQIPATLKNAVEHAEQAQNAANRAADAVKTGALPLLQAYNGLQNKVNAATAAQSQAQGAAQKAQVQVFRAQEADTANQVFLAQRLHTDSVARAVKDADVAAAAARANQVPPISVLAGATGAQLLNIVNVQKVVSDGYIKLSDLAPAQLSGIVAQGGGNIVAQGGGNIRIADLTPAMLQGIVAQGGGNIVAQGGGNLVAQGGGNIVAQGAGNIVAQGAGNIVAQGGGNLAQIAAVMGIVAQGAGNLVAQGGGNIVAQGGGNIVAQGGGNIVAQGGGNLGNIVSAALSNARATQTALLTAGLQASIISNDGASLIGRAAARGLISNDGASLITNDGGSMIRRTGAQSVISNDGASARAASIAAMATNGISGNISSLIAQNKAAGLVAAGGGNIVAQGAGNIVAQGAGNLQLRGPSLYKDSSPSSAAAAPANASMTAPPPVTVPVPSAQPRGVAGGGFKQDSTISISGSYVDQNSGAIIHTPSAGPVVASAPATTTSAAAGPTIPAATAATPQPARPYDPNDWTTWPKADVASFMPPGKTVQQFKAGAEKDLVTYRKNLAALPATGLTPAQQSQKAGIEAQIRSLEFQVDTANRSLGLPSLATQPAANAPTQMAVAPPAPAPARAPVPVMSAAAIANSAPLQNDLAAAQTAVNNRAQQIASANQGLSELQAQRAKATDPAAQKGLDAAISSAKFQIDVMQQALVKENQQVTSLQQTATKTAASTPTVNVPAGPAPSNQPAAAVVHEAVKITKDQQKAVHNSLRTIPGKLSALEKRQFETLSKLIDKAATKGLNAEEAKALKNGISALAARHPKAAQRHNLAVLANTAGAGAAQPKPVHAATTPASSPPPAVNPDAGSGRQSTTHPTTSAQPGTPAAAKPGAAIANRTPAASPPKPSAPTAINRPVTPAQQAKPNAAPKPAVATAPKPPVAPTPAPAPTPLKPPGR